MPFAKLLARNALPVVALVAATGFGAADATAARLFPDLSEQMEERVVCSVSAAAKYEIPANILLAIREKEGGKPGQWVKNTNGTYDVGELQFNTAYLGDLAKYGITAQDVAAAGCYPYDLAAWRLRGHIRNDRGDLWTRAANYHSRTPSKNAIYRADLMAKADKWAKWLDARFVTVNYGPSSPAQPAGKGTTLAAADAPAAAPAEAQPVKQGRITRTSFRSSGYVPRQLIINNTP
ncbi:muramidase [Pseudomonas aeruginosa]|uniref:muramidase n=1 Tax=Pseudomonas aeruginosa TaxID=287 RepID=UPI0015F0FE3A|nr:muramidase [Pseudomonas aeruginosa]MBA4953735.1 muramidase [Pseudomonas aeruginosa]HDX2569693.1 muramidase [Escherichia coli]